MRIVAGALKGRVFSSPNNQRTHPMSDKVRGALFNMLGDLSGLRVLDAFAGTGALSFEAISRGAIQAVAIEMDTSAQRVIADNIRSLGLRARIKLIKANAAAWLQTSSPADTYDIVLCDPPYHDLQTNVLLRLTGRVRPGGLFVLSWPTSVQVADFDGLELLEQRTHGDATLVFYRQNQ